MHTTYKQSQRKTWNAMIQYYNKPKWQLMESFLKKMWTAMKYYYNKPKTATDGM